MSALSQYIAEANSHVVFLEERVATLENALRGIASCATQCDCCRMHVRIALRALGEADVLSQDKDAATC